MRGTQAGPRRRLRSAVGSIAIAGIVVTVTAPANASGEQSGTIRVWTHQNQSFNDSLQALADEYIEANPDVEIEFETFDYDTYIQTLQTALPAGTEADILQMFGDWTCGYSSNLATVPEGIATIESATPLFFEAPLDGYTCGDQLYGLPMEFNIEYGAALANTRIAEEAGVDLDAGFESWDQFTEAAVAMAEGEPGNLIRSGFHFTTNDGMAHMFLAGIVQQGGSYLNEDGTAFTFDTPEARATLEVMKGIIDAGANDPVLFGDTTNWVGDCFFVEDCAMGLIGPWVIGEYRARLSRHRRDLPLRAAAALRGSHRAELRGRLRLGDDRVEQQREPGAGVGLHPLCRSRRGKRGAMEHRHGNDPSPAGKRRR